MSLIYVEAEAYEVALLPEIILIVSFAIAIICCIIAELKYIAEFKIWERLPRQIKGVKKE